MAYITKKSDKGGSKAKEKYIAKSNIFEKPKYITKKKKKKEWITKKEKKDLVDKAQDTFNLLKKHYPKIGTDY